MYIRDRPGVLNVIANFFIPDDRIHIFLQRLGDRTDGILGSLRKDTHIDQKCEENNTLFHITSLPSLTPLVRHAWLPPICKTPEDLDNQSEYTGLLICNELVTVMMSPIFAQLY